MNLDLLINELALRVRLGKGMTITVSEKRQPIPYFRGRPCLGLAWGEKYQYRYSPRQVKRILHALVSANSSPCDDMSAFVASAMMVVRS